MHYSIVRNHKLFDQVRAVVLIPNSVLDLEAPSYEHYDFNKTPVTLAAILSQYPNIDMEETLLDMHENDQLFQYLNFIGFSIITEKLSVADNDDMFLHGGFMSHLYQDHDIKSYRLLPEMWANVWANMINKLLGNEGYLYPAELLMEDKDWYASMIKVLGEEVMRGEYDIATAIYKEHINLRAGDCGALQLGNLNNNLTDLLDMLKEATTSMLGPEDEEYTEEEDAELKPVKGGSFKDFLSTIRNHPGESLRDYIKRMNGRVEDGTFDEPDPTMEPKDNVPAYSDEPTPQVPDQQTEAMYNAEVDKDLIEPEADMIGEGAPVMIPDLPTGEQLYPDTTKD